MRVRSDTTFKTPRPLFDGFGVSRTPSEGEPLPAPPPTAPDPIAQLGPDQYLVPGQTLVSRGGTSRLVHQTDGNVVIYTNGTPVWATNTQGATTHFFTMEAGTGNLVLYQNTGVSFWNSGTSGHPGAYLQLLDAGELRIVAPNGAVLFTTRPAPIPTPPTSGGGVAAEVLERSKRIVNEMMVVLVTKVGPLPLFPTTGNMADWVSTVIAWTRRANELAQTDPEVASAWNAIVALQPPDSRGGLFGAIDWVKEKVRTVVSAAGGAISFVLGDLPSPDDYDPENLIVTTFTNPIKFGVLTGLAAIIFPPAVAYMAAFALPAPAAGLTLALGKAYLRGGAQRVVDNILEPLGEYLGNLLNTIIDFAFNREVALVRWVLRKIASKLPDAVPKGIVLALADAADAVVDALRNIASLKGEGFYVDVGGAITKVSAQFSGQLQEALRLAGDAIHAGGRAVSIIIDKGLAGLKEAMNAFVEVILGIPEGFEALPQTAQVEIARAKVAGIAMATAIVQNLNQGIRDFANAASNIPGGLKDLLGAAAGLTGKFSDEVAAFLERLMALASVVDDPIPEGPSPNQIPTPDSGPAPAPSASGGATSKLLAIGAGGLVGALLGGPVGAVVGAGAGVALVKG